MKTTTVKVAEALIAACREVYIKPDVHIDQLFNFLQDAAMSSQHASGMHEDGISVEDCDQRDWEWAQGFGGLCASISSEMEDILYCERQEVELTFGSGI